MWATQIKDFRKYGLNLSGDFAGMCGLAVVLNHALLSLDPTLFKVRYRISEENGDAQVAFSLLEHIPITDKTENLINATQKARWNQCMSSRGKIFKTQKCLTPSDIRNIHSLYDSFCHCLKQPFLDIPSDLGKVVLMRDGTLKAMKPIKDGEIITSVPTSKCETFDNPRIWIGIISGYILKKPWPFCGFGGFVQWHNKNFNCRMTCHSSSIVIIATQNINVKDPIICCENFCKLSAGPTDVNLDTIRSIAQKLCETGSQTRAREKRQLLPMEDENNE